MSSFWKCKSYSHFFSKNISVHAIFNDQSFNDTLINNIVSFEQLGPGTKMKCITFNETSFNVKDGHNDFWQLKRFFKSYVRDSNRL